MTASPHQFTLQLNGVINTLHSYFIWLEGGAENKIMLTELPVSSPRYTSYQQMSATIYVTVSS